jgi:hypothetical protein
MATTEDDRFRLQQRLREQLGEREAVTLMELLPPVGWADVATKRDLEHLEQRMDARFAGVDARFGALEQRMELRFQAQDARFEAALERGLRRNLLATITAFAVVNGATVALAQLLG